MVRWYRPLPASLLLAGALAGSAAAQAVVEHSLGSARAVTTTAPAQKLGKSMKGLGDTVNKVLKGAPQQGAKTTTAVTMAPTTPTAAAPAKTYESARQIETGMTYEEVLRRFGPASLESFDGAAKVLYYPGGVDVEVVDGKVKSVAKPAATPKS